MDEAESLYSAFMGDIFHEIGDEKFHDDFHESGDENFHETRSFARFLNDLRQELETRGDFCEIVDD